MTATFTSMENSSAADWREIGAEARKASLTLTDRVLAHLKLLDGDCGGFPVDRYQHSLQTATLALKAGKDEEYVVCALLHDIGDTLGAHNHFDVAAAVLKPFVSEANLWMVQHHGIFQGYFFFHHIGLDRNLREQFRGHEHFAQTEEFCALYDNPAFNPGAKALPISEFEPMVRRVFSEVKNSIYKDNTAMLAAA